MAAHLFCRCKHLLLLKFPVATQYSSKKVYILHIASYTDKSDDMISVMQKEPFIVHFTFQ